MAQLCETCKSKLATVTGTYYFHADEEPYESGERIELDIENYANVGALYCEKCDKIKKIWES